MKKHILMVLSALVLVSSLIGVGGATPVLAASPNLVVNGDFETSNLTGWTVFQTDNGVTNEAITETITSQSVPASYAATFRTGRASTDTSDLQGGGIEQTFDVPAGGWVASLNVGVLDARPPFIPGTNIPIPAIHGPKVELLVDNTAVDLWDLSGPNSYLMPSRPTYKKLSASGMFSSAGSHTVAIRMTSYQWESSPTGAPLYEFVDNVKLLMPPFVNSQPVWEYGAHYYQVVPGAMTWDQANTAANTTADIDGKPYQGHLATISTPEENAFVYNLIIEKAATGGRGWIGGRQLPDQASISEGWQWVTGENMNYRNWDPATGDSPIPSPNDAGGPNSGYHPGSGDPKYPYFGLEDNGENFMEMRGDGYWDDLGDTINDSSYVIEFEPPINLITDGGVAKADVGDLHIAYTSGQFNIEFTVAAPWQIVETQVYIGNNPPSKSSPGQFPHKAGVIPFTPSSGSVYIAAHAKVALQTGTDISGNPVYTYESIWAQNGLTDTSIGKGTNWATCFQHTLP